jgi:hypothetical protein
VPSASPRLPIFSPGGAGSSLEASSAPSPKCVEKGYSPKFSFTEFSEKFVLKVVLLLYHRLGWPWGRYGIGVTVYHLPLSVFGSKGHRNP